MTEKNYTSPEFGKAAFHCPHCGTYARQVWFGLIGHQGSGMLLNFSREFPPNNWNLHNSYWQIHVSKCEFPECQRESVWVGGKMLFPDVSAYPSANDDMPDNVKEIYGEAAAIANKSPRAAAMLLRLALQELCKSQGCPGGNLIEQIKCLEAKKGLPPIAVKTMDALRLTGNDAAHPEKFGIDVAKNPGIVLKLFRFINLITRRVISEPKRLEEDIEEIGKGVPENKKIQPRNGEKP